MPPLLPMTLSTIPYLIGFQDTIVDKNKILLLADSGLIYNLKTEKKIFNLNYSPEKCAVRNEMLVCVYRRNILVHNLKTKEYRTLDVKLNNDASAICYEEMLAIGCWNGEIFLFNGDFEFIKIIQVGTGKIPIIVNNKSAIIAINATGELGIFENNELKILNLAEKLTAVTVNNENENNTIIVGDQKGFLHFIEPDLSMYRKRISEQPITFLFFHHNIYCITEGFVRKINRNGAKKIYGTVCSDPSKIFRFKDQVFCTSLIIGVLPLIDREEDLYDKIMQF